MAPQCLVSPRSFPGCRVPSRTSSPQSLPRMLKPLNLTPSLGISRIIVTQSLFIEQTWKALDRTCISLALGNRRAARGKGVREGARTMRESRVAAWGGSAMCQELSPRARRWSGGRQVVGHRVPEQATPWLFCVLPHLHPAIPQGLQQGAYRGGRVPQRGSLIFRHSGDHRGACVGHQGPRESRGPASGWRLVSWATEESQRRGDGGESGVIKRGADLEPRGPHPAPTCPHLPGQGRAGDGELSFQGLV